MVAGLLAVRYLWALMNIYCRVCRVKKRWKSVNILRSFWQERIGDPQCSLSARQHDAGLQYRRSKHVILGLNTMAFFRAWPSISSNRPIICRFIYDHIKLLLN